jgi:ATP-dependent RNA helicase DDX46/PRP5
VIPQAEDKFMRLMELLGLYFDKGSILIFVDKQLEADELFKELYKVGYKALVLHGG